jgi:hypothetical protein
MKRTRRKLVRPPHLLMNRRMWLYFAVGLGFFGHGTFAALCVMLYIGNARFKK